METAIVQPEASAIRAVAAPARGESKQQTRKTNSDVQSDILFFIELVLDRDFLDAPSLCNLRLTSRSLCRACSSERPWRGLFRVLWQWKEPRPPTEMQAVAAALFASDYVSRIDISPFSKTYLSPVTREIADKILAAALFPGDDVALEAFTSSTAYAPFNTRQELEARQEIAKTTVAPHGNFEPLCEQRRRCLAWMRPGYCLGMWAQVYRAVVFLNGSSATEPAVRRNVGRHFAIQEAFPELSPPPWNSHQPFPTLRAGTYIENDGCEPDGSCSVDFEDDTTLTPTVRAHFYDSDRNSWNAFHQHPLLKPELFGPGSEGRLAAEAGLEGEAAASLGWRLRGEPRPLEPYANFPTMEVEAPWLLDGESLSPDAVASHRGLAFLAQLSRLALSHPAECEWGRQKAFLEEEKLRRQVARLVDAALRMESVRLLSLVSPSFAQAVLKRFVFSSSRSGGDSCSPDSAPGETPWLFPMQDVHGNRFYRPGRGWVRGDREFWIHPEVATPGWEKAVAFPNPPLAYPPLRSRPPLWASARRAFRTPAKRKRGRGGGGPGTISNASRLLRRTVTFLLLDEVLQSWPDSLDETYEFTYAEWRLRPRWVPRTCVSIDSPYRELWPLVPLVRALQLVHLLPRIFSRAEREIRNQQATVSNGSCGNEDANMVDPLYRAVSRKMIEKLGVSGDAMREFEKKIYGAFP